jgi:hypothetical protein
VTDHEAVHLALLDAGVPERIRRQLGRRFEREHRAVPDPLGCPFCEACDRGAPHRHQSNSGSTCLPISLVYFLQGSTNAGSFAQLETIV